MRKELERLRAKEAGTTAAELLANAPTVGGVKLVVHRISGEMRDLMRLSKEICEDPKATAILGATSDESSSLIVSHGSDVAIDSTDVLAAALPVIGAKGGGRSDFAQGSGPATDRIEEALLAARREAEARLAAQVG